MTSRTARLIAICALAALALSVPARAIAANAYGQTFAGKANCLGCHGNKTGRWQVGTYPETAHGRFISDFSESPSLLFPTAAFWPSPAFGGGYSFAAGEIRWMLGAPGVGHQYVSGYKNDRTQTLASGQQLATVPGPSDDYQMVNGAASSASGVWELSAKVSTRPYFQNCGGCHFLGVTRPTDTNYTLASGAQVGRNTPTSFAGIGIQCENCHGTGKAGTSHWTAGVDIVRTRRVLKSQTCGQCHVNGTAKEKSFLGATFSGPNGFTPDRNLEDFYLVSGVQYIKTSPTSVPPTITTADTKFYPNGSNKGMKHSFYNEWMLGKHARSFKYKDGSYWTAKPQQRCLECHSGEGFLTKLGYGKSEPNDIGLGGSSVASDTLNIECAVCHTVHNLTGDALGLRMEAEELCTECHNSETTGTAEFVPGTTPHHTQKEMRGGYGLIGVPRSTRIFMGAEAECITCHMPVTKYTLKSHSFKVMTPGNAAAWKVQEKGDSCTPCHSSRSRAALQADLDRWRAEITSLTADATSATAAAQTRVASSTPAGIDLIASAKTNVGYVTADKSFGAHNFGYARNGLRRAAVFARSVGARYSRFGLTPYDKTRKVAVAYGTLTFGDGTPAASETVTIEGRKGTNGAWTVVGTAPTAIDGDFSVWVTPGRFTHFRAVFAPKVTVRLASKTLKLSTKGAGK
jgi:predicted CXXCH cytochrome family protein